MKTAVTVAFGCALCAPLAARATRMFAYDAGGPDIPGAIEELSCTLDVEARGALVSFEFVQHFVNRGQRSAGLVYEHDLPAGAVVSGFAVKNDRGGVNQAIAVDEGFQSQLVRAPDVLGDDPALLELDEDGRARAIVQPILPGATTTLVTKFVALAVVRGGAFHIAVPGRPALKKCVVRVHATVGPGASLVKVRPGAVTELADPPLSIDIEFAIAGNDPVVWTHSQRLIDDWQASLVTVAAPRLMAAGGRRVVFLLDVSRSMALIGRDRVMQVVRAVAGALPAGTPIEAVAFDRSASRIFGELRPVSPRAIDDIDAALAKRGGTNGGDLVRGFELVKQIVGGGRGTAQVIVISDGMIGDLSEQALRNAVGERASAIDVHAVVLDPAATRSPGAVQLRGAVELFGGSLVEVGVDDLDDALASVDSWLRPGFLKLAINGLGDDVPTEVPSGGGFSRLVIERAAPARTLAGVRNGEPFRAAARGVTGGRIDALALSHVLDSEPGVALSSSQRVRAIAASGHADRGRALAVLSTSGRVAANRRAMVAGGGSYERMVVWADPELPAVASAAASSQPRSTPIARDTLERLFRHELQPKAYACYQTALGLDAKLEGTARFHIRLGRGEVTDVEIAGIANDKFIACLTDAAFGMAPPIPNFSINSDDQTVANYPLTFARRKDQQAYVVAGDADSSSPLDIDNIEGGVPVPPRGTKVKVNTKTPLGDMRPPK